MKGPVLLASNSPRRRELLATLLDDFQIVNSDADESIWSSDNPRAVAEELAFRKASSVSREERDGLILAADTVIDLDGEVVGKPADAEDAFRILSRLKGRVHQVITALALIDREMGRESVCSVVTDVEMRSYGDQELWGYIDTGEPFDKAGAYGIQARGGSLVRLSQGCYNNVIGLPLCEVSRQLASFGKKSTPGVPCRLPSGSPCPRLSTERESAYE